MKRLLFMTLFVLMATPAAASDRFAQIDSNADQAIDWPEFEAAMPQIKKKAFDLIDTDKNGRISREEWNAFGMSHGKHSMGPAAGNAPAPSGDAARPLIQPPTK
ncbi:MAG TPA: EF-hand domain-containing protein [Candidatus Avidesulfovibrio excrementigallinarum]|nr:EF-hand domain-containing protein [Candidatus Avidesulfovibrio excrementigallinarum]